MNHMGHELDLLGKRVMLVGGAGFIGHHLALDFGRRGAEVAIVDSLQVNNLLSLHDHASAPRERELYSYMVSQRLQLLQAGGVPLFVDDARDYHRLGKRFSEFQPDVVVLLSAVSHASRANKDPRNTLDHSFRTLENALDLSRNIGAHFIFFSSSMVYGDFPAESVDEQVPCNPIAIYGAVKLGGEKLVAAYGRVFDMPFTIIRPSALYGERCISRRVGQVFIENAIRGRDLVVMGDGQDCVDFTYIADLVQGTGLIVREEKSRGEIFNITYGKAQSLNALAEEVRRQFPDVGVCHEARDALVPERGTLDVSKARDLLGYNPRYAIQDGVPLYAEWYRQMGQVFDLGLLADLPSQQNE